MEMLTAFGLRLLIPAGCLQQAGVGRGQARRDEVVRLLELVGLEEAAAGRFPHEQLGGQRQANRDRKVRAAHLTCSSAPFECTRRAA
jgi:ABC-type glutathione transport system ATPase component